MTLTHKLESIIRRKDGRCLIIEIKRDDPALAEDEARIARGEEPATTEGRPAFHHAPGQ